MPADVDVSSVDIGFGLLSVFVDEMFSSKNNNTHTSANPEIFRSKI